MRRIQILSIFVVALLIAACAYLYFNLQSQQLSGKTSELQKQIKICGNRIEDYYQGFVEEINYLVDVKDMDQVYSQENSELIRRIKRIYLKYDKIISSVRIYDIGGNMVIINKDAYNYFKILRINNSSTRNIVSTPRVIVEGYLYKYTVPLTDEDGLVFANISFSLSIPNFVESEFSDYYLGKESWQFLINNEGYVLKAKYSEKEISVDTIYKINDKSFIVNEINKGLEGVTHNSIDYQNSKANFLSVYYPINFFKNRFGIVFSVEEGSISSSVNKDIVVFFITAIAVIAIIIFVFVFIIRQQASSEAKVRQSLVALDMIIDNLPVGIFVTNKKNIIGKINNAALQMMGFSNQQEIYGKTPFDLLDIPIRLPRNIGKGVYSDKKQIKTNKGEEITILLTIVPVTLNNESFFLNTFVDISEIEKAIKAQQAANKMKSEFLANMSHEIRTPMNGILGITDLLAETTVNAEQKELIDLIQDSTQVLLRIINDILDYSKIEAGKMMLEKMPFSLRQIMKSIREGFAIQAGAKKLSVNVNIDEKIPDGLIGDPIRLQQVFSNLIGNAIKFTHEGEILVNVGIISHSPQEIEVVFSVADTGIGIPKESLGKMFQSFTQLDSSMSRKYGGTGLGLAISKQLVELMNGKIKVKSPSGISKNEKYPGSIFTFSARFLVK
jgi:PAS domain S-box-containing protein